MKSLIYIFFCMMIINAKAEWKRLPNQPDNLHFTLLDNGLELLVIENNTVPLATIEIVVKNGAFVQTPDLNGLAHLYEHMFFKANKTYPSQEKFLERINELGIQFNGTTSDERVNYYLTLNKSNLQAGLDFMNSAIRYPLFLQEEMKKENVVVAGEFQRNESNPFFFLLRDLGNHLWGDLYPRKNSIGEYEVILNATPEIMKSIQERYYYPNNSMLVIAGDVKHEEVYQAVNKLFGDWKPSSFNIFEKYPIPDFKPLKTNKNFITESVLAQVPIYLKALHGPDTRKDPQATYAADILSYILQQKNSKLQKRLVETGLAYEVQVTYQTCKYVGPINLVLVPNPDKIQEAIKVFEEEVSKFSDADYYTDEQIQTAKEMLEIQEEYGKEKTSEYIHTVTYWWSSADLSYMYNYNDNLKKVTRQDINNFINKYLKSKPAVTGILVSPTMRKSLKIDSFFKTN